MSQLVSFVVERKQSLEKGQQLERNDMCCSGSRKDAEERHEDSWRSVWTLAVHRLFFSTPSLTSLRAFIFELLVTMATDPRVKQTVPNMSCNAAVSLLVCYGRGSVVLVPQKLIHCPTTHPPWNPDASEQHGALPTSSHYGQSWSRQNTDGQALQNALDAQERPLWPSWAGAIWSIRSFGRSYDDPRAQMVAPHPASSGRGLWPR
ncbi:hypothetical protein EYF80_021106 [Liparis tanakae]|uniref:Uncharacterized protein n=1 Tax=Liparis tanakae TaxID=230148 RepID=A0A4Z2HSL2_9TELE|nr:hypothetical protein EYF80_021106 [Liparis tanakae]